MPVSETAVRITAENVHLYEVVHRELEANLPWLAAKTKDYPVEVVIRGVRFVFDSEAEIRATIALIASQLRALKAA